MIFSTLSSVKTTKHYYRRYAQLRHKFQKILEICKKFAGNQVDEKGNVPRCGFVPTFSDLEVVALSITAEALSIDSENYLFKRLNTECQEAKWTLRQNGSQGGCLHRVAIHQSSQS